MWAHGGLIELSIIMFAKSLLCVWMCVYNIQVEMLVKTKETFGSLDIVCNNAGIEDETNSETTVSIWLVSDARMQ